MYFGKKFKLTFENLKEGDRNKILKILFNANNENIQVEGYYSPKNQKILQIIFNSKSEEYLNENYLNIIQDIDELNINYSIEELLPIAEITFENVLGVEENFLKEIINKKRNKGSAKLGSIIFHTKYVPERVEYVATADILLNCQLQTHQVF